MERKIIFFFTVPSKHTHFNTPVHCFNIFCSKNKNNRIRITNSLNSYDIILLLYCIILVYLHSKNNGKEEKSQPDTVDQKAAMIDILQTPTNLVIMKQNPPFNYTIATEQRQILAELLNCIVLNCKGQ